MKIELEVDPTDLAKSLKEILDTLPPADRLELARKAMESWLRDPIDAERRAKERWAIDKIKADSGNGYGSVKNDEEARRDWRFNDLMKGFKSTKEQMIETITQEISANYKAQVKNVIESDPRIQVMKDEVVKIVKETFPAMVHDAMVTFMSSNMHMMLMSSMGAEAVAKRVESLQSAVAQRLNEVESRVASRM
jgi:hypothetical protein